MTGREQRQGAAPGFVLACGASSRFGSDKALAKLSGRTALARTIELLRDCGVREVIIVGERTKYGKFGAGCIEDKWPGEGPLGGIITALRRSGVDKYGYRWNLIVSCDMPFLSREWLAYLIKIAEASDAEVIVPNSERGLESLCACWRTSVLASLERDFDAGIRKITEAMSHLRMEVLDEAVWKRFDSADRLFLNMNTPEDYQAAARILEKEKA